MVVDEIYWLDQIQSSHRSAVGDKAFYLGLLSQWQFPAVPGFVVPVAAFQDFLSRVNWQGQMFVDLPHSSLYVDTNNPRQLQVVAQDIRQAILATPLPDSLLETLQHQIQQWQTSAVIFRPSFGLQSGLDPTVSSRTTGLLQSQICRPERETLAQGLKQTWAELFRARSLFYWQHLGIQLQQIQFAVLVQPIESVIAAGEMIVTPDHLQIQATWGLGHGLQGDSSADRYSINLRSGLQRHQVGRKVYAYQIAASEAPHPVISTWLTSVQPCLDFSLIAPEQQSQPVLSLEQFQELAYLGRQIQSEFNMPLKLEWTLARSTNHPTQTNNPLQTLPVFYFTQVTPQFSSTAQALHPAEISNIKTQILPQAAHFQTGLAAAPGRAVAAAWLLDQNADLTAVPANVIVVASVVTPEQVIGLRQAAGLVTEQGGMTSHAAILARELGIPAIVGVAQITRLIQSGDSIAIDGDRGIVYYGEIDTATDWISTQTTAPQTTAAAPSQIDRPRPPRKVQLLVTLSQPTRLARIASASVDGVGLLRSELLLLELFEQTHPLSWLKDHSTTAAAQISERILPFVKAFAPRPVFYRSLDLRSHEFSGEVISTPNAMLGIRGSFSYQVDPSGFKTELAALKQLQQRGYHNLRLLLPFVRTVEEFIFCRQQVEQAGLTQDPAFQVWIMAEVPSVLMLLPDYVAAGVQGITIGTNDLTQLLLGVDRDHPQMAAAFNPYHPAVLRAIQQLVQTAHQLGIPCAICGQALERHPDFVRSLIEWGVTALSVELNEWEAVDQTLLELSAEG
jgi:pyruvate, water dikinase